MQFNYFCGKIVCLMMFNYRMSDVLASLERDHLNCAFSFCLSGFSALIHCKLPGKTASGKLKDKCSLLSFYSHILYKISQTFLKGILHDPLCLSNQIKKDLQDELETAFYCIYLVKTRCKKGPLHQSKILNPKATEINALLAIKMPCY